METKTEPTPPRILTGSNEHHTQIDSRLAALECTVISLKGLASSQSGTISTLQSTVSNLQSSVGSYGTRIDRLEIGAQRAPVTPANS